SPITLSTEPPNWVTTSPISAIDRSTIARTSSGSLRSESAVKPDRSANMTVIQRRSPSISSEPAPAGPGEQGAPQAPQTRKPGGFSCPQAGHARLSEAPQWPQKRCAAALTSSQVGQTAVPATAQPPGGDVPGIPTKTAAR